jgi:excisionase family DNA binding protein
MLQELLTVRQVAEIMNTSIGHIYRLIAQGYLIATNIAPGSKRSCLRVTRNAVVNFLEEEDSKKKVIPMKNYTRQSTSTPTGIRKLRTRNPISNGRPPIPVPPDSEPVTAVATFLNINSGV